MDALVSSNASMIGKPFTSVSPSSFSRCKMTCLSCSVSLESCWPPWFGSLNEARHCSFRSFISMISILQASGTPAVCLGCVFNIHFSRGAAAGLCHSHRPLSGVHFFYRGSAADAPLLGPQINPASRETPAWRETLRDTAKPGKVPIPKPRSRRECPKAREKCGGG